MLDNVCKNPETQAQTSAALICKQKFDVALVHSSSNEDTHNVISDCWQNGWYLEVTCHSDLLA